jgi:glycosyltransferase involved in cell wall biosynthesis
MIIVLTVAGLVENKGYFTLLKAAQKIVPNEPNIKFITVGECPLRPKIESFITPKNCVKMQFLQRGVS